jgi:hypothetical protein
VTVPALVAGAGDRAALRFLEFFTVNIRNPNTRAAYARSTGDFQQVKQMKRSAENLPEPLVRLD